MATALWGGVRGGVASLGHGSNTPVWLSFGPKMAQDGFKMASRWLQDGIKMQDSPKRAHDGFKVALDGPKWLQDGFDLPSRILENGALA